MSWTEGEQFHDENSQFYDANSRKRSVDFSTESSPSALFSQSVSAQKMTRNREENKREMSFSGVNVSLGREEVLCITSKSSKEI